MRRKMIAVSPETWAGLKKAQAARISGGTAPSLGRLVEMGLEAIKILADLETFHGVNTAELLKLWRESLNTFAPKTEPEASHHADLMQWLERAEAAIGGKT